MKQKILFAIIASLFFFPLSCSKIVAHRCAGDNETITTTTRVVATGLNDPRGLKFGPDGMLYVAEAGVGGTNLSGGCMQVPMPVGPYTGSDTGARISRIDWNGVRTTVADHLPSSTTAAGGGNAIQGVADVEFIGNTLYAILAGAGCSHGVPDIPNGIIRINPDKTWTMVANNSAFLMANPVANPDSDDFEPDGTPYSMTHIGKDLYITEPNQQEIDKISPATGKISRIVDMSVLHPGNLPAPNGWIGCTSMVYHNGNLYFGTLTKFPLVDGAASVYKLLPNGTYSVYATGFTMVVGIAFDTDNNLYVLENTVGYPGPTPGAGDIVRVTPGGKRQVIVTGLNLPTAMTFGPDGKLYVSDWGIGPPGLGDIIQVSFNCQYVRGDVNK